MLVQCWSSVAYTELAGLLLHVSSHKHHNGNNNSHSEITIALERGQSSENWSQHL